MELVIDSIYYRRWNYRVKNESKSKRVEKLGIIESNCNRTRLILWNVVL